METTTNSSSASVNVALQPDCIIQQKTAATPGLTLSCEVKLSADKHENKTYYFYKDEECRNRFTTADGWCMLVGVYGAFGSEEGVAVWADAHGNWEGYVTRGGNDVTARVRAVIVDPVSYFNAEESAK